MKISRYDIIFAIIIIATLVVIFLFLVNLPPDITTSDITAVTDATINSLGNANTYTPTTIVVTPPPTVSNKIARQRQAATQIVTAPTVIYSPFDKTAYTSYTAAGHTDGLLPAATCTSYANTLHTKLGLLNSFTALAWNPANTVSSLTGDFTTQLQISQLAAAYYTAYGTDMISDITNTCTGFAKGRDFINQITTAANALPQGY